MCKSHSFGTDYGSLNRHVLSLLLSASENYTHENQFMFETHSCGVCKDHLPREVTMGNSLRVKYFDSLGGFDAVIINKTDGITDLKMPHLLWSEIFLANIYFL